MDIKVYKYFSPVVIYLLAILSFSFYGWLTWLPMLYAWMLLPLIELFIKQDKYNMDAAEEELAKKTGCTITYSISSLSFNTLPWFIFFLP